MKIKTFIIVIIILIWVYLAWIVPYKKKPHQYIQLFNEATNELHYERALRILDNNIDEKSTFEHFYYYGIAYHNLNQFDQAEENYEKAIGQDSSKIDPYLRLARIFYLAKSDYESAWKYLYKAANVDSLDQDLLNEKGILFYESGEIQNSEDMFRKSIELDSTNYFSLYNLGTFYLRVNELNLADLYLNRSLKHNIDTLYLDEIYEHLGVLYFKRNDHIKAKDYFIKSHSLVKNRENVNFHLGIMYSNEGNHIEAIKHYTNTISFNQSDYKAYFNRARSFFELERFEEAIVDLDYALTINPIGAEIYGLRGNAKFLIHDDEGACLDFKKAKALGLQQYSKLIQHNC